MPTADKILMLECAWELAVARALVRFGTYKKWKHRLGQGVATPDGAQPPEPIDPETERRAKHIGFMLWRVSHYLPFKANCLPQASAGQVMLRRRGITEGEVFVGARKGTKGDPLDLHAWLYVGSTCVTGDDGPGRLATFKPLIRYSFPRAGE